MSIAVSFHDKASKALWMKEQQIKATDSAIIKDGITQLIVDESLAPYVQLENWGHLIYRLEAA